LLRNRSEEAHPGHAQGRDSSRFLRSAALDSLPRADAAVVFPSEAIPSV
jgi:hypothetical protein